MLKYISIKQTIFYIYKFSLDNSYVLALSLNSLLINWFILLLSSLLSTSSVDAIELQVETFQGIKLLCFKF